MRMRALAIVLTVFYCLPASRAIRIICVLYSCSWREHTHTHTDTQREAHVRKPIMNIGINSSSCQFMLRRGLLLLPANSSAPIVSVTSFRFIFYFFLCMNIVIQYALAILTCTSFLLWFFFFVIYSVFRLRKSVCTLALLQWRSSDPFVLRCGVYANTYSCHFYFI